MWPWWGLLVLAGCGRIGFDDLGSGGGGTSGAPDPTFGVDGVATTSVTTLDDHLTHFAIQADGRIVAVGENSQKSLVVRLAADGSIDPSFGASGSVVEGLDGIVNGARFVTLYPDGRMLVVGHHAETGSGNDILVMRLLADGSFDTTWNGSGWLRWGSPGEWELGYGATLTAANAVLVGGIYIPSPYGIPALVRLLDTGALDTSFGTAGSFEASALVSDTIGFGPTIVPYPDGTVALAGYSQPASGRNFRVAKIRAQGTTWDDCFAGNCNGTVTGTEGRFDMTFSSFDLATGAVLAPDDTLVVTGVIGMAAPHASVVVRLTATGALDGSFAGGGVRMLDPGEDLSIQSVAVQPDGKIVVAGSLGGSPGELAVLRLLADGTADPCFGDPACAAGGEVRVASLQTGSHVAIAADGGIVVGGDADVGGKLGFGLVKLLP